MDIRFNLLSTGSTKRVSVGETRKQSRGYQIYACIRTLCGQTGRNQKAGEGPYIPMNRLHPGIPASRHPRPGVRVPFSPLHLISLSVMIIKEKRQLFQAFIMWDHFWEGRRSVFEWVSVKAVGIRYHADRPCWCNLFPRNFCASCGRASRISDLLLSSFRRLFHTSSRTRYALRLLLLQFFPNFLLTSPSVGWEPVSKAKCLLYALGWSAGRLGGVKSSAGSFFCSASPS